MKIYYFKKSHRDYYNIMRISIIVLFFLIIGCETTQRNPKCEDVRAFKVFQVLDKFVLASICEYYDTQYCMGHTVIFKKEKGKIYYDDQVIKVKDNECAIYTGTYRYQTQGGYKTVPIVKIINSKMPNAE